MKATLEFNLGDLDDEVAHGLAIHGQDFALVCVDIDQVLRDWLKHGHNFKTADEALQEIRDVLHGCLDDRGISLEMIQ